MPKKICISGYYGFDNFGDETILNILIENLKKYNLTVFSSNPLKTSSLYEVKSVYSFDIKAVIKELYNCDCLISGGGSLLQDITSIKSLIYYLSVIFLAQIFKKKTIIFAQGIGPVRNKVLAALTFYILRKAAYVSVRDEESLKLMSAHNIKADLCTDPVWNILPVEEKDKNITGIQLRSFYSLRDEFLEKLAYCVNRYYSNKIINIFSLQNEQDLDVCIKFKNYLKKINPNINAYVLENISNEKIINDIAQTDELIAMRYHACLVGIKNKIRLLPLVYDIKVKTLAEKFRLNYINLNSYTDLEEIFDKFVNSNILYNDKEIDKLNHDFQKLENLINE